MFFKTHLKCRHRSQSAQTVDAILSDEEIHLYFSPYLIKQQMRLDSVGATFLNKLVTCPPASAVKYYFQHALMHHY